MVKGFLDQMQPLCPTFAHVANYLLLAMRVKGVVRGAGRRAFKIPPPIIATPSLGKKDKGDFRLLIIELSNADYCIGKKKIIIILYHVNSLQKL